MSRPNLFFLASITFILGVFGKNGYPNVNVTVYAETNCPCWGMWQHMFHDKVMSTDVSSIIDLYIYWDGTAEPNGTIKCFHGEKECRSSILQQCAMSVSKWDIDNPSNFQQWMNFEYCIYGT